MSSSVLHNSIVNCFILIEFVVVEYFSGIVYTWVVFIYIKKELKIKQPDQVSKFIMNKFIIS